MSDLIISTKSNQYCEFATKIYDLEFNGKPLNKKIINKKNILCQLCRNYHFNWLRELFVTTIRKISRFSRGRPPFVRSEYKSRKRIWEPLGKEKAATDIFRVRATVRRVYVLLVQNLEDTWHERWRRRQTRKEARR